MEYLTCYVPAPGLSRPGGAVAFRVFLGLKPDLKKKNDEDAGTLEYKPAVAGKLIELRERLGAFLDAKRPAAKQQLVQWEIRTEETPREVVNLKK